MILTLNRVERIEYNVKSYIEGRECVDRYTLEYRDEDDREYRRAVEVTPGTEPTIHQQQEVKTRLED